MSKVLEIQNLSYGKILDGVSFSWHQNEVIALMGANGSGKSTLARLIAGLIEPADGEVYLRVNGNICPWNSVRRWQEIGLVGQHPRRQTVGATVAEEISFGLLNLGLDIQVVRKKVQELTDLLGLKEKVNQSPATLSGGERQRLVTAAVLVLRPSFLILDEALTMLDVRAQTSVLELLLQAQEETGQLWITHDQELACRADRVLWLDKGKVEDLGKPERAFSSQKKSCLYLNFESTKHKIETEKNILKKMDQQPVLEWRNANYNSRLHVNKVVRAGEFIGIVGPSGSGKTTLLESAIGLTLPTEGQFLVNGDQINKKNRNINSFRGKIRLIQQEAGEYLIGRTVLQEVFYGETRRQLRIDWESKLLYLKKFGIQSTMAEAAPERLSGGERQKTALAAALKSRPETLLLDEPLLGLDAVSRAGIKALITEMKGITILYVTHDIREIIEDADRFWLIEQGQIVQDCSRQCWKQHIEQFRAAGVRC
jgi:energy-coupling factor transport system ATP-binding protein